MVSEFDKLEGEGREVRREGSREQAGRGSEPGPAGPGQATARASNQGQQDQGQQDQGQYGEDRDQQRQQGY